MNGSTRILGVVFLMAGLVFAGPAHGADKDGNEKNKQTREDAYADYVWPPPPDTARIRLVDIIDERADVEAESKLRRILIGAEPEKPYDRMKKPFAVEIDDSGRILVTEPMNGAVLRFDRKERRMDVFGTTGSARLRTPLGLCMADGSSFLVADAGAARVVAFDDSGDVVKVYGKPGELVNPTDVAVSPGGDRIFVTDSKAHRVVVYDRETAKVVTGFGTRGEGDGEFNYPSALAFGPEGSLFVVDQINSRVQIFTDEGEYLDQFGSLGVGFANFVRPKDIAIDSDGLIYVTDAAFNNVQIFDIDIQLLTFVGEGGSGPGQFSIASGVAIRGDLFAIVDQLNRRVQLFEFIEPRGGE